MRLVIQPEISIDDYVCAICSTTGVRLYRPYQTFSVELRCSKCVPPYDKSDRLQVPKRQIEYEKGWWVCAVPAETEDHETIKAGGGLRLYQTTGLSGGEIYQNHNRKNDCLSC